MPKNPLRFGIHDFLNAQPLLVPLLQKQAQTGIQVETGSPAQLAERLKWGSLDSAMIPVAEYFRQAGTCRLVRGPCIASRGPVGTVLFASKLPLARLDTIAVDQRSRTSIALLKILFADQFSPNVVLVPQKPDLRAMLETCDAGLIIGDEAFRVNRAGKGLTVYDLSEEWFRRTGKTFVHAVVAVRKEADSPEDLGKILQSCCDEGLLRIHEIAENHGRKYGIDPSLCEDYLKNRILYRLEKAELEGLNHFRDLCIANDLISKNPAGKLQSL